MFIRPSGPGNSYVFNLDTEFFLNLMGMVSQDYAIWCFNKVAVTPIVFRILHVVKDDKFIHTGNEVKITFPRDVIGLNYSRLLSHFRLGLPSSVP